jgi:hypothetical protein
VFKMSRINREILRQAENKFYSSSYFYESSEVASKRALEIITRDNQRQEFLKNESIAKSIIDSLLINTRFSITEQCLEEPSGEITYDVVIKRKEDKKVFYGIENSKKVKSANYLGFCLQTHLMIRDEFDKPIINQEFVDQLLSNQNNLPQIRKTA